MVPLPRMHQMNDGTGACIAISSRREEQTRLCELETAIASAGIRASA